MCQLLETICIRDGELMHVDYHRQRMAYSAASLFPGYIPPDPEQLISLNERALLHGTHKYRIIYGPGCLKTQIIPYPFKIIRSLKLVETDLDYSYKYADRKALEALFEMRQHADDVLLVKDGRITDTSIANIVFVKGRQFFTPDKPLLQGTALQRLLDEKKLIATEIKPKDLKFFDSFILINAMRVVYPLKPIPISGIIK